MLIPPASRPPARTSSTDRQREEPSADGADGAECDGARPACFTESVPVTEVHHPHSRYVSVGQQRLRVTVADEGLGERPHVLVNGIGATGVLYNPLREHFSDRETIAFDAPGVDKSPAPLLPRSMRQTADVVAGMVHQRQNLLEEREPR